MEELRSLILEYLDSLTNLSETRAYAYRESVIRCDNPAELREFADLELQMESLEYFDALVREVNQAEREINSIYSDVPLYTHSGTPADDGEYDPLSVDEDVNMRDFAGFEVGSFDPLADDAIADTEAMPESGDLTAAHEDEFDPDGTDDDNRDFDDVDDDYDSELGAFDFSEAFRNALPAETIAKLAEDSVPPKMDIAAVNSIFKQSIAELESSVAVPRPDKRAAQVKQPLREPQGVKAPPPAKTGLLGTLTQSLRK